MNYADALAALDDGYGYTARPQDIQFLRLQEREVISLVEKEYPLGMSAQQYDCFRNELYDAIKADGLEEADVRLKGSSASFYSGHHKKMPFTNGQVDRQQLFVYFRDEHKQVPSATMLDVITDAIDSQWPSTLPRPTRRPFDAMHRLSLCPEPSDYDVQISCDTIMARAEQFILERGLEPKEALVKNPTYAFINKELVHRCCPRVEEWRILQSHFLGRPVTVAAFPRRGPDDHSSEVGEVSSHFRDTDWIVNFDG